MPSIETQQIDTTANIVTDHTSESRYGSSNLSNLPEPVDKIYSKPSRRNSSYYVKLLQQELETRDLPLVELIAFDRNPLYWPEFINGLKTRIHLKIIF